MTLVRHILSTSRESPSECKSRVLKVTLLKVVDYRKSNETDFEVNVNYRALFWPKVEIYFHDERSRFS